MTPLELAHSWPQGGHYPHACFRHAIPEAGHATLAILPCGLDRAHPHDHAQLLSSVAASGGAVVSLYRPGTAASGATLKASARLLAEQIAVLVPDPAATLALL
ncbi:LOG family protein [Streptomyces chiangmaiensis]|uniref:Smf/DprA SLOG domain-containing protein n=1 Tax=Streptomyces chiangmaiensis TaxID=766497 RepID=A0ABU7FME8_9ACTN|nr:hypothetical protein [Streptomyces chiangmaiensis]MED7824993.1 hypothetical protein [Streptomyces chiangmaiensis]